jgi:hypothetical protein
MKTKAETTIPDHLPFTVEPATTDALLEAAVRVRQAAYARHLPDVAKTMVTAEEWDTREGAVVFVARSKLDGEPVGSMRIHTTEVAPLPLEQSVTLPEKFSGKLLAEATRLAVVRESVGSLAKFALFKAYFRYCLAHDVDYMVITARNPLDRMYDRLCFLDVGQTGEFMPMAHVGGLMHRVMYLPVREVEPLWTACAHPLLNFIVHSEHSDIKVTKKPARDFAMMADSSESSPA